MAFLHMRYHSRAWPKSPVAKLSHFAKGVAILCSRMSWRIPLIISGILALGGWLIAQSPDSASRLGYVTSTAIVEAHSDFPKVKALQDKAKAEISPINDQLKALQAKVQAGTATTQERDQYQTLSKTVRDAATRWQKQQNEVLDPINQDANKAVTKIAKEQGFGIIIDADVARESNLVIYADADLNLTDAVIKALPK